MDVAPKDNLDQPRCSVSGLPIRQDRAWQDVDFGREFSISLSTIGSNILLAEPKGYITLDDVKQYLAFIDGFFKEAFDDGQTVFGLLDSSRIVGMSSEARRYYIERNKAVSRFGGIVFFNASLVLKVSIRLGKSLNIFDFDVEIAGDYSQAIKAALQMMERSGITMSGLSSHKMDHLGRQSAISVKQDRVKIRTDPDWCLDLDGFSVHYEIIADDILHTVAKGHLREQHMPYVWEAFEGVFDKVGLPQKSFYYINGVNDLEGMTWKARMRYIEFTSRWYKKHPFPLWFIHGANRFMRTATHLGSYFVPYEVRVVDDLSGALDIIAAHKARNKQIPPATFRAGDQTKNQAQQYVDELLQFLGGIDWDSSDTIYSEPMDSSHPFKPVFEAIQLIKMDLDQLFLERKQAFDAYGKSEEKYRNILENMEEGYVEVDLAGNLTFFNESMRRIIGYTKDRLLKMNNREFMEAATAKIVYSAFNGVYKSGQPIKSMKWEIITADGFKRYVRSSVALIRSADGSPTGFRCVVQDVTDQLHAEAERKQLETRLQQAQKMEAIGTLAGGVAHDLNNILSGLVSYPELLLMDLPQESPYREPIEIMKRSGERAAVIVQDLLTLARRSVPVLETLSANQIVAEYLISPEMETLRAEYPRTRIETELASNLMNMQGSPVHLSKMLMNLISNAFEAMPQGGYVTIRTENCGFEKPLMGYESVPPGEYIRLSVSDRGLGMSTEVAARLFEPFFTRKSKGRTGTGLGMAVVWATVKDHGGYIDLHSRENEGTTFWVYFPATDKTVNLETPAPSVETYMGNGESVLVVDDVAEQREIASGILRRLGYKVHAVPSGEAAVEYLTTHASDLLVLDMIMKPGIDGLETYRQILQQHPGQKAIIASGYSETDQVKETLSLGAGTYIRKPYLLETMGKAVRAVLTS